MSARGVVLAGLALAFAARAGGAPAEPPAPPFYADRTNLLQVVDASGALRPIKDAADLALRRRHTLEHMTLVMGRVPEEFRATALAPRVIEEAAEPKFTRKKIALRVEPADTMTAYLLLPRGLTGKAPAVLCLHQTTAMGKAEPAGLGGDADLAYARELAERGYVTLAPDCWDFGDYRRSPYDPYAQGYASGTHEVPLEPHARLGLPRVAARGGRRAHRLHRPFARRAQHALARRLRSARQGGGLKLRLLLHGELRGLALCGFRKF